MPKPIAKPRNEATLKRELPCKYGGKRLNIIGVETGREWSESFGN